ncbi:IQ and ubiquitin-like domain-containing protein [Cimex lectularius]|uniref:IQ motif and ubiquitin-like domain-containing protein n=1 Tax=Cimex lectularius TaxID=79782 RepID=A0A8I6S2Y9_CIMLE|nr:IQ and ubiquitin-like domain-containing protein [Cimex lectularius]
MDEPEYNYNEQDTIDTMHMEDEEEEMVGEFVEDYEEGVMEPTLDTDISEGGLEDESEIVDELEDELIEGIVNEKEQTSNVSITDVQEGLNLRTQLVEEPLVLETPPPSNEPSVELNYISMGTSPMHSELSIQKDVNEERPIGPIGPHKIKSASEVFFDDVKVKFCMVDDIERAIEIDLNSGLTVKEALKELGKHVHKDASDMTLYSFYTRKKMHHRDLLAKYLMPEQDKLITRVFLTYDDSSEGSTVIPEEYEPDLRIQKVLVHKPDGSKKYLEVLIHNIAYTKEWCGGFRNKKTGIEYYNTWTQTNPLERGRGLPPGMWPPTLYTRETQTHLPYVTSDMNTPYEKSTQVWRKDSYIPSSSDKILDVRPYVCYDELYKTLTPYQAVLILQRFFRYCLAKSRLKKAVSIASEQNKAAVNFKGVLNEEIHRDRMALLIKETFPLNRGDFYDLYTILGIWKQKELQNIKETTEGISRKAAIAELLDKEIQCLYNIENQRIKSKTESMRRIDMRVLQNSARYEVTRYRKGNLTIIDTLATQRANEFKEIFSAYQTLDLTKEERIDILTTWKIMLSKLEGLDVTKDIIELLDRETDLLLLDIPNNKLVGLRKRVESLFFNMIKSPEFNTQVLNLTKSNESRLKQPLYKCKGCGKVKSPAYFFSHLRLLSFHFCMSCSWMHTTANATINLAPYTRLLNMLRASETMKCCRSSVVFLLQPMGMYYIMNVIWQGQSALSGTSYLPELRMTRWNRQEEWAPWNTILLTEAEATVHDALDDLQKFYTRWFILQVKNKHILARMHFSKVYTTDLELRESGKWTSVKDEGFYTSRRHTENLGKDCINDFFKSPHGLNYVDTYEEPSGAKTMVSTGV